MSNIYGMCTRGRLLRREGVKDAMTYENQEHRGAEVAHVNKCRSSYLVDIVQATAATLLPLVSPPMDDSLRRLTSLGSTIKMSLSVHSAEGWQDVLSTNVGSCSFYMFFLVSSHLALRKFGMKIELQKLIVCYYHYTIKDHCNFL